MADKAKDDAQQGPQQMEVGGSGDAKVSFKDPFGGDAKPTKVTWASNNGLFSVTQDEKDPLSAKIFASGAGLVTISATGVGENGGSAVAQVVVLALAKDSLSTGEIELSVKPAPAKPKSAEPEKQPEHTGAHQGAQPSKQHA